MEAASSQASLVTELDLEAPSDIIGVWLNPVSISFLHLCRDLSLEVSVLRLFLFGLLLSILSLLLQLLCDLPLQLLIVLKKSLLRRLGRVREVSLILQ